MNFVQQLEECLRDLASEARKKHPGVKEASERATLRLRSLKNVYVSAVRRAANAGTTSATGSTAATAGADGVSSSSAPHRHPTTALFQSSDLLHPFLLAANYPTASSRLLEISFTAMRLLMEADAVVPTDGIHMVRVWMIQAQVVVSFYQKLYAKEIKASEKQQQMMTSQPQPQQTSTGSSWFGWGSSSGNSASGSAGDGSAEVKNAVSSSSGQTGTASQSPDKMEKLALEILSCLLQLLELLKSNYPTMMASDLWSSATALGCLWLHYLPARHTVRQAARSTVSQVLSLLAETATTNGGNNASAASTRLMSATWQDLLVLACRSGHAGNGTEIPLQRSLQGAFSQCRAAGAHAGGARSGGTTPSVPPSADFALELMTRLWKEKRTVASAGASLSKSKSSSSWQGGDQLLSFFSADEPLLSKTLSATVKLLEQQQSRSVGSGGIAKALRTTQWTLAVIQALAADYPTECRELFMKLLRPVLTATEACRSSHDFEDGYAYTHEEAAAFMAAFPCNSAAAAVDASMDVSTNSISSAAEGRSASKDTTQQQQQRQNLSCYFPSSVLWKAAFCLEATHRLLESEDHAKVLLFQDAALANTVAEALSDFCTVGASCRDHMLQLVETSAASGSAISGGGWAGGSGSDGSDHYDRDDDEWLLTTSTEAAAMTTGGRNNGGSVGDHHNKPAVFRRAEQALALGWSLDGSSEGFGGTSSQKNSEKKPPSNSSLSSSSEASKQPLGDALWLAFVSILRMVKLVGNIAPQADNCDNETNRNDKDNRNGSAVVAARVSKEVLLDEMFSPVLAVLQHYLKRFAGSDCLVQLTLHGYTWLADPVLTAAASLPEPSPQSLLQRKALLSSLCKLSLPAWGKHDAGGLLRDHHVRALVAVLVIVHRHYDRVGAEWDMILWTFQDLSVLKTASPLLSPAAFPSALAVSAAYGRWAGLSTCFSDDSLQSFIAALSEIAQSSMGLRDVVGDAEQRQVLPPPPAPAAVDDRGNGVVASSSTGGGAVSSDSVSAVGSSAGGGSPPAAAAGTATAGGGDVGGGTISEKIMSIGVRAIYGTQQPTPPPQQQQQQQQHPQPQAGYGDVAGDGGGISALGRPYPSSERGRTSFFEEYRRDFVARISSCKSVVAIRTGSSSGGADLSFCLIALADTVWANAFRQGTAAEDMSRQLFALAASTSSIRPFVMDVLSMLTLSHLKKKTTAAVAVAANGKGVLSHRDNEFPAPFCGPGRIVFVDKPMQSQLWAVEAVPVPKGQAGTTPTGGRVSQRDLVAPLCDLIRTTETCDVAEVALHSLTIVLEGAGHNLEGDEVWSYIIFAVTSLSGDDEDGGGNEGDCEHEDRKVNHRSRPEWSKCCLAAFKCLKFIVDDFLDQLPAVTAERKQELSSQSSSSSSSSSSPSARACLLDSCSSFASSRHDVNTSLTAIGLLWTIADQDADPVAIDRALAKLAHLSSDGRQEVRNAAVNTLFSCIVGRGAGFSSAMNDQWESCLAGTVFGVYDAVLDRIRRQGQDDDGRGRQPAAELPSLSSSSRYRVSLHHSRDSAAKQWGTTQVLVLQGLIRVLRNYFTQLLDTTDAVTDGNLNNENDEETVVPWFQDAWVRILDFAFEAAHQEGGRDTLEIRSVGVEMLVVCCQLASSAGIQAALTPARVGTNMEVVNGALRSVRANTSSSMTCSSARAPFRRSHSVATDQTRQKLFLEAFESLESYQEFLEKTSVAVCWQEQQKQQPPADDARQQVLHKFCSGLAKLYDCCKDREFYVDQGNRSLRSLSWERRRPKNENSSDGNDGEQEEENDDIDKDLEARFVAIVASVLEASGCGSSHRYLNQAQRCAIDLLKSLASDGSSEAFLYLVDAASGSFFVRRDSSDSVDESECGFVETEAAAAQQPTTYDVVHFEAAAAVSAAVSKDAVSDACRILVLYRVLSVFIDEQNDQGGTGVTRNTGTGTAEDRQGNKKEHRRSKRFYYKRVLSVIERGLQASARLDSGDSCRDQEVRAMITKARDLLWDKQCTALSHMLSPVPLGKELMKISRVLELQEMVTFAVSNVPCGFVPKLCSILSYGASQSLEVARRHESFAIANHQMNGDPPARKSKRHREDVLKLFAICFSGTCYLHPEDPALKSIAQDALEGAIQAIAASSQPSTSSSSAEAMILPNNSVSVEASLRVCEALKTNAPKRSGAAALVLSVFSLLCQLLVTSSSSSSSSSPSNQGTGAGAGDSRLRRAVAEVFAAVDVGSVLDATQRRCEEAERRSAQAETTARDLRVAVQDLQRKNESLQEEVAVLQQRQHQQKAAAGNSTGRR